MRIGVTISRGWDDWETVLDALEQACQGISYHKVTVVHGDSKEDFFIGGVAYMLGMDRDPHAADWKSQRRAAGVIRNVKMVRSGADIWLAFIGPCSQPGCSLPKPHGSHGASHCALTAESAGIPVRRYTA